MVGLKLLVIAIIIAIMVLEKRVLHRANLDGLISVFII